MATDDVNSWHNQYTGLLGDFRLYDSALSDEQVGYLASNGTGYVSLVSTMNIYDAEAEGSKAVNFKDYALLMASWLEEKLWPE